MRKLIIFTVIGLIAIQANVFPITNFEKTLEVKELKSSPIKLYGKTRVRFGVKPSIEVFQNTNNLELLFNQSMGNLNIIITNVNGNTVYQRVVNAVSGGTLIISTQGWSGGSYIICITDEDGEKREGTFEK